jgi:hypothetical protein
MPKKVLYKSITRSWSKEVRDAFLEEHKEVIQNLENEMKNNPRKFTVVTRYDKENKDA